MNYEKKVNCEEINFTFITLKKSLSDRVSSIASIVCLAISYRCPNIEPDTSNIMTTFFDIVALFMYLNIENKRKEWTEQICSFSLLNYCI